MIGRKIMKVLVATVLCAFLFAGCGEKTIRGEVIEVISDGQTGEFSFVIDQDVGGLKTIKTDADTYFFSWIEEATEKDLREGNVDGMLVSVTGRKRSEAFIAEHVMIEQLRIRNYHALEDGTQVDIIIGLNEHTYCLGNITELLRVRNPVGPHNVQVVGVESLDSLPEEAQQNVIAYYDAQGLFYDEFQTLQDAYDAYCTWDKFYAFYLSQEIIPTASSDDVIYFLTDFMSDRGYEGTEELRLGAAFDKKTGEFIPVTELFTCKPEEILPKLIEICDLDDAALIEEMEQSFIPEYVVFFPENLEITFPESALPAYGVSSALAIDFTKNEDLLKLLQPWAVPNKEVKE